MSKKGIYTLTNNWSLNGFALLKRAPDVPKEVVYKCMPANYAIDFICNGNFFIANPKTWDDPYEMKFIDKADYKNHPKFQQPKATYCTCFTNKPANEASWITYSYKRSGIESRSIKIKIGVNPFLDFVDQKLRGLKLIDPAIYWGKVKYDLTKKSIDTLPKKSSVYHNDFFNPLTWDRYADLLLIKRKDFDYEHECRLIVLCNSDEEKGLIISFSDYELNKLIEEVLIDPRCTPLEVELLKYQILKKIKDPSKVKQYPLYQKSVTKFIVE